MALGQTRYQKLRGEFSSSYKADAFVTGFKMANFCNLLFVLFSAQKKTVSFYVDDRFSLVYVLVLLV